MDKLMDLVGLILKKKADEHRKTFKRGTVVGALTEVLIESG